MCAKSSSGVRIYLQARQVADATTAITCDVNATRIGRMLRPSCSADRPAIRSRPSRANLDGELSSGPTGYAGKGVRPSSPAAQRVRPRVNLALMTSPSTLRLLRRIGDASGTGRNGAIAADDADGRQFRCAPVRLSSLDRNNARLFLAKRFWTSYTRTILRSNDF
jgi:hypothetical protein